MIHTGQCHCGNLQASFDTQKTPAELGVRTCQCAFCRRHGAINISDPEGLITINAAPDDLHRYTFSLRTADFLICENCGVYIAAVMGECDAIVSTINVAGLHMDAFAGVPPSPAGYDAETSDDRIKRRYQKWTPTRFSHPELAASNFGPH